MSGGEDDVAALVGELVETLQELEAEVAPTTERGFPRPPTPGELVRFTSDVAIPGAILVLRTNVEALKLLRRALRLADGRPPASDGATAVRAGAERVGRETLSRLDAALSELQDAVAGRPEDDDVRVLLDRARDLRDDVADAIGEAPPDSADVETGGQTRHEAPGQAGSSVAVDVEAELQSLKQDLEDEERADGDVQDGTNGASEPGETSDGEAPGETADGETPDGTADGGAPGETADGETPDGTADGGAPGETSDGEAPTPADGEGETPD